MLPQGPSWPYACSRGRSKALLLMDRKCQPSQAFFLVQSWLWHPGVLHTFILDPSMPDVGTEQSTPECTLVSRYHSFTLCIVHNNPPASPPLPSLTKYASLGEGCSHHGWGRNSYDSWGPRTDPCIYGTLHIRSRKRKCTGKPTLRKKSNLNMECVSRAALPDISVHISPFFQAPSSN